VRPAAAIAIACAPTLLALTAGQSKPAPDRGERAYQKCYSCPSLGGNEKLEGPALGGIVGRRVAARAGFAYSPALKRFAADQPAWTPQLLDRFIADPESLVPGTTMAFTGIRDAQERAALIAYLQRSARSAE
jgi:cytochrome c